MRALYLWKRIGTGDTQGIFWSPSPPPLAYWHTDTLIPPKLASEYFDPHCQQLSEIISGFCDKTKTLKLSQTEKLWLSGVCFVLIWVTTVTVFVCCKGGHSTFIAVFNKKQLKKKTEKAQAWQRPLAWICPLWRLRNGAKPESAWCVWDKRESWRILFV